MTDQLAFAVIEESFGDADHAEPLLYFVARIHEQRKADLLPGRVIPKISCPIAGNREALRRDPGDKEALYDLYLCLQQQGKHDEARETLARLERVSADLRRLSVLTKELARGSSL